MNDAEARAENESALKQEIERYMDAKYNTVDSQIEKFNSEKARRRDSVAEIERKLRERVAKQYE